MTKQTTFKKVRLFNVSRELNVAIDTLMQHLEDDGFKDVLTGKGVNASITDEDAYLSLLEAFAQDMETAARVKEKRAARLAQIESEAEDGDDGAEALEEVAEPPVAQAPEAEAPEAPEPEAAEEPAAPEPEAVPAPEPEAAAPAPAAAPAARRPMQPRLPPAAA